MLNKHGITLESVKLDIPRIFMHSSLLAILFSLLIVCCLAADDSVEQLY